MFLVLWYKKPEVLCMKNSIKIISMAIFIIIVICIVLIIDNLRVIEPPLEEVVEIAKKVDGNNLKRHTYAYTLEREETILQSHIVML